jgi:hypothetical protein
MTWLAYADYSLYAAIVCTVLAYVAFPLLRTKYSIGRYTTAVLTWVFGVTILAFTVGFFGPLVVARGGDTVLPVFGSLFVGPLGAFVGLAAFWIYAFRHKRT